MLRVKTKREAGNSFQFQKEYNEQQQQQQHANYNEKQSRDASKVNRFARVRLLIKTTDIKYTHNRASPPCIIWHHRMQTHLRKYVCSLPVVRKRRTASSCETLNAARLGLESMSHLLYALVLLTS